VEGIAVERLSARDVVRHPLVMRIIRAYEKDDEKQKSAPPTTRRKENNEG
jgi:phosphate starvation-inducible PhoH-like protein